jgi:hypothetical protein
MALCPNHGELNEKVDQMEQKIDCIEIKQYDLRKPDDGALAKMHEKMNTIAANMATKSELRWVLGVLIVIFMAVISGSISYTSSVDNKVMEVKHTLDSETVTKQDFKDLRQEMLNCMEDIKKELRRRDRQ